MVLCFNVYLFVGFLVVAFVILGVCMFDCVLLVCFLFVLSFCLMFRLCWWFACVCLWLVHVLLLFV